MANGLIVQKHTFSYTYDGQTISFDVWSSNTTTHVDTVIFLGTVQIGKLPAWIAEVSPEKTVVVQGLPHWLAKADGSDLLTFTEQFTEVAFKSVLDTYHTTQVTLIAESQAAPCVTGLAASEEYAPKVKGLILLQPLGLNASSFTGAPAERIKAFKKRIARNFRYQLSSILLDKRLRHNHLQMYKTVGYDNARFSDQYNTGLLSDAVPDLKRVYKQHKLLAVICGANDMLFPIAEIKDTLKKAGIDAPVVAIPKVPHSPLATRLGNRLLQAAFTYLPE